MAQQQVQKQRTKVKRDNSPPADAPTVSQRTQRLLSGQPVRAHRGRRFHP